MVIIQSLQNVCGKCGECLMYQTTCYIRHLEMTGWRWWIPKMCGIYIKRLPSMFTESHSL